MISEGFVMTFLMEVSLYFIGLVCRKSMHTLYHVDVVWPFNYYYNTITYSHYST